MVFVFKYEKVIFLFSGIVGFSEFCVKYLDVEGVIMIINFLNDVYVKFDDFLKINFDVYKVLKICDFIVNLLF